MNVRQAKKVWRARLSGRSVSRGRLDPAEDVLNKAFNRAPRRSDWLATMPDGGWRWGRWDPMPGRVVLSDAQVDAIELAGFEHFEAWCVRCKGCGYHHGFGEGGRDPDWCLDCGGAGRHLVGYPEAA